MERDARVALVTGASGGVGRHAALRLAERGYGLALVGRDEGRLRETGAEVARLGVRVECLPADIAEPGAPETIVAWVGKVDVLVNAAGTFGPLELLAAADPNQWLQTLQVNVVAPYRFARATVGGMLARGHGRIINVSSMAALNPPTPLNSAYATSKVALNQWTATLAAELEGTGVTANALHPGEIKTRMWADIDSAARRAGDVAAPFVAWAEEVRASGGDDPDRAARQIVAIADGPADVNGSFFVLGAVYQDGVPESAQGLRVQRAAA